MALIMPLTETKYELLPGDYGVVRTSGILACLIRFFTRSEWNHAFIYVGDGKVVEASYRGAVISPLKNYGPKNHLAFNYKETINKDRRDAIVAKAYGLVGTPYNFLDIFVLWLRQLGIWTFGIERRLIRNDRLICSQLVDYAYDLAGVHLFTDGRTPGDVTPGDLGARSTMALEPPA